MNKLLVLFLFLTSHFLFAQKSINIEKIKAMKGFVALWDFKEPEGQDRRAVGKGDFPLKETNGNRTLAAKKIGMPRRTFHRKLHTYHLEGL
jgi:DNA-binding NtrC family response regulator